MSSAAADISSHAVLLPDEDSQGNRNDEPTETMEELEQSYEAEQLRKIFIGSLNYNTTDEQLKQYYSQWGEVAESIVPKDNRTKLSKGFGFIIYAEAKSLDVAMKARPHKLNDRTLEPRRAIRRDEADNPAANASTNKLYFGPLSRDCTRDDIGNYFAKHGNVLEVEVAAGNAHAFVTFDDFDPVDKCVNMKKHMIAGHIGIAKKGLTKSAMTEAEKSYAARKKRRGEREDRERRDYEAIKSGYNIGGGAGDRHRRYPDNFGRGDNRRGGGYHGGQHGGHHGGYGGPPGMYGGPGYYNGGYGAPPPQAYGQDQGGWQNQPRW